MRESDLKRWEKLPPKIQRDIVDHLVYVLSEDTIGSIKKEIEADPDGWATPYHYGWGMWIRNSLREGVGVDTILPSKSWDDYYIVGVEKAIENVTTDES